MKKTVRFVDCGANVGQSIEWAIDTLSDYNFKIDSFEPNPELVEIIKKEIFATMPTNVNVVNLHAAAVDIIDSKKKFYLQEGGAKTSSSLFRGKESTYVQMLICGDVYYKKDEKFYKLEFRWKEPTIDDPKPVPTLPLSCKLG